MDIQLEMIATHTYTVDYVYQLAFKIKEGLKFWASRHRNSQLGRTFSNWTASKPLITSSLKISTNENGGLNNQQTLKTMNKGGSKGQTPMSTGDRTPYAINVGDLVIMWLCAQVKVYTFVLKN